MGSQAALKGDGSDGSHISVTDGRLRHDLNARHREATTKPPKDLTHGQLPNVVMLSPRVKQQADANDPEAKSSKEQVFEVPIAQLRTPPRMPNAFDAIDWVAEE